MEKIVSTATKNITWIASASQAQPRNDGMFFTRILIFILKIYQKTVSPFLGNCCRFYPSCSAYAKEALERWGLFRGSWFILKRVVRCSPLHPGGYDPVPE